MQALFFFLGGIRDNLMLGKTIMPDEEYLQSWFYDTKLGDAENHSDRMHAIAMAWGAFIATIALLKMAVALTGGKTQLAKTLAVKGADHSSFFPPFAVSARCACETLWSRAHVHP